jgi:hypothetical protein
VATPIVRPLASIIIGLAGLLAAVAAAVAVIFVLFGPVTDLIARHDAGSVTGPHRAAALQSARDAARGRLLQLGAGLFAVAALIYTARNFALSREGQVTDRYTKAIEQIGSDKPLDVRIGGIYALERVARDSPRDHATIMEVLAAFIREHSHEQWPPSVGNERAAAPPKRRTRPDVQAALTVLGRRTPRYDRPGQRIDLGGADLRGTNLAQAYLSVADLEGANLAGTNLAQAYLSAADLEGANLAGADLAAADLTYAYIANADLTNVNLTNANLTQTLLTGAKLTGAKLDGAIWPTNEAVPEGWQRDNAGRLARIGSGQGGEAN